MVSSRRAVLAALAVIFLLTLPAFAQSIPDFTFVQATDVHAPLNPSPEVIAQMKTLGDIPMTPYGFTAKAPSFVVVSGDATEFGGGDGAWDAYLSYWKDFKIPVYHTLGNHDGPWFVNRPYIRKLYGGRSTWSFDKFGCHFIGLDNSTPHDPRANITEEQFVWLKDDLKKLKPTTPVFLVMHHPINDTYFGSPYAVARFLDLLRPYNLVAVLMGHGHSAGVDHLYGIDDIQGGATVGPSNPGFNVLAVKDGTLYTAYMLKGATSADKPIIKKPIPAKSTYPKIEILSPSENGIRRTGQQMIKVRVSGNEKPIVKATWSVDRTSFKDDDEGTNPMSYVDGVYQAEAHYDEWVSGMHYIQVAFTDQDGVRYTKCVRFGTEPEPSRLIWRTFVGGSCRGSATVAGNMVYVGATDSKLYALDKATGAVKWSFPTGGDVCTKPLVVGDTVYFGSGDGKLYAVSTTGQRKWTFAVKEGIYSSPTYADGLILFGSDDSNFYAVDAKTGQQAWVFEDPVYTIEVKPYVDNGTVYFGAWDQYLYALDVKTGKLKWKCSSHGADVQKAKRYYSPADCGPVAASGKAVCADRNSDLSIIDATTGTISKWEGDCVGVGISQDGKSLYARKPSAGALEKLDLNGNPIWKVPAEVDSVPAAPVEKDGIVYVVQRLGLVQAFSAEDGRALWQYQATPMLYVLSEVEAADGVVYVTGMDGSITALKAK